MKQILLYAGIVGGLYYLYLLDEKNNKKIVVLNHPKQVKKYFDKLIINDMPKDIEFWIAGGSVADAFTKGKINGDIDIYFPNQESFDKAVEHFSSKGVMQYDEQNSMKFKCPNYEVDLVKTFYPTKEQTVANFDYTVCCGTVDRNGVSFDDRFIYALKNKKLQVNSLVNPIGAVKRIKKYAKRGYDLSNKELRKLTNKISTTDIHELYASGKSAYGSYGGSKAKPKPSPTPKPKPKPTAEPKVTEKKDYMWLLILAGGGLATHLILKK